MGKHIASGGFADVFNATLKIRSSWLKPSTRVPVVVKELRNRGDYEQRLRVVAVSLPSSRSDEELKPIVGPCSRVDRVVAPRPP